MEPAGATNLSLASAAAASSAEAEAFFASRAIWSWSDPHPLVFLLGVYSGGAFFGGLVYVFSLGRARLRRLRREEEAIATAAVEASTLEEGIELKPGEVSRAHLESRLRHAGNRVEEIGIKVAAGHKSLGAELLVWKQRRDELLEERRRSVWALTPRAAEQASASRAANPLLGSPEISKLVNTGQARLEAGKEKLAQAVATPWFITVQRQAWAALYFVIALYFLWSMFADVLSDIRVMRLLFDTGNLVMGALAAVFILLQYVVVYTRVLAYLEAESRLAGRSLAALRARAAAGHALPEGAVEAAEATLARQEKHARTFAPFGLPMLLVLDAILFAEPLIGCAVHLVPEGLLRFLPAYRATRYVMEVAFESLPQLVLQSYAFIGCTWPASLGGAAAFGFNAAGSPQGMRALSHALAPSLLFSMNSMLIAWAQLLLGFGQHRRPEGISLEAWLLRLWRMGGGLPLDGLKSNTLLALDCAPPHPGSDPGPSPSPNTLLDEEPSSPNTAGADRLDDDQVQLLVQALDLNHSLERLDVSRAELAAGSYRRLQAFPEPTAKAEEVMEAEAEAREGGGEGASVPASAGGEAGGEADKAGGEAEKAGGEAGSEAAGSLPSGSLPGGSLPGWLTAGVAEVQAGVAGLKLQSAEMAKGAEAASKQRAAALLRHFKHLEQTTGRAEGAAQPRLRMLGDALGRGAAAGLRTLVVSPSGFEIDVSALRAAQEASRAAYVEELPLLQDRGPSIDDVLIMGAILRRPPSSPEGRRPSAAAVLDHFFESALADELQLGEIEARIKKAMLSGLVRWEMLQELLVFLRDARRWVPRLKGLSLLTSVKGKPTPLEAVETARLQKALESARAAEVPSARLRTAGDLLTEARRRRLELKITAEASAVAAAAVALVLMLLHLRQLIGALTS